MEGETKGGRVLQKEGGCGRREDGVGEGGKGERDGRGMEWEGGREVGREGGRERGREREGGYYKEREGGMEGITRVV